MAAFQGIPLQLLRNSKRSEIKMKTISQIVLLAFLLGGGYAGWQYRESLPIIGSFFEQPAHQTKGKKRRGPRSVGVIVGEMGIGNTTAASAVACSLLSCPAPLLVGPGTGLDAQGINHKAQVIEQALQLHAAQTGDALGSLRALGGFEVAALVGAYLACAQEGIAALVDGFICTVAALVAVRLNPSCREWLFFGHRGAEPGHRHVLETLQAEPLLELGLRLGEGSGAALAVPLVRLACELHNGMATFAEAAVADRPA